MSPMDSRNLAAFTFTYLTKFLEAQDPMGEAEKKWELLRAIDDEPDTNPSPDTNPQQPKSMFSGGKCKNEF